MLRRKQVVSCFLICEGRILLLRRSSQVSTYQGRWGAVSGYIEQKSSDEQALIEIAEETGLKEEDVKLLKKGEPLEIRDEKLGIKWRVYPYLFSIKNGGKIRIDWEHEEFKWIDPAELGNYDTVPMLRETLARVWPV